MGVAVPSTVPGPGCLLSKLRMLLFKRTELRIVFPAGLASRPGCARFSVPAAKHSRTGCFLGGFLVFFLLASEVSTINSHFPLNTRAFLCAQRLVRRRNNEARPGPSQPFPARAERRCVGLTAPVASLALFGSSYVANVSRPGYV